MAAASRAKPSRTSEFVVADFTAGSGELLFAAASLWPTATIVATDIDSRSVRSLRAMSGSWRTGVCDFLNPRSRRSSGLLRSLIGKTNLVLLNPPFSCRGGTKVPATIGGVTSKCSMGLAFVVNSIDYLAEDGELIAVLPQGSLTSERDSATWKMLRDHGATEILKTNGLGTFARAAVRTAVIRFQKGRAHGNCEVCPCLSTRNAPRKITRASVHIVRGTTAVNEIQRPAGENESIPFIHSVHLQDFAVSSHFEVRSRLGRRAFGPMVLLPRVGQPKRSKIARHLENTGFMLSDCVIALTCHSPESAELLWKDLQSNWKLLEGEYVGSGARYITNRRLSDLLLRLGYFPSVGASGVDCGATRSHQDGTSKNHRC